MGGLMGVLIGQCGIWEIVEWMGEMMVYNRVV